jgi:hypothetical protein
LESLVFRDFEAVNGAPRRAFEERPFFERAMGSSALPIMTIDSLKVPEDFHPRDRWRIASKPEARL